MKMSEPEFTNFNQVAEKAFQAELVCSLIEDHPHAFAETEVSALASLVKNLTGDVYAYMSEIIYQQENKK